MDPAAAAAAAAALAQQQQVAHLRRRHADLRQRLREQRRGSRELLAACARELQDKETEIQEVRELRNLRH